MSESLVFITGGTGFIGSHVISATLKAEYRVLLSIRKPEQEEEVRQRYPGFNDKIETVVVPYISSVEAIKNALNDKVEYVFHLASPMPGRGSDVRSDYVNPAVQGTESVLLAANEFPNIQKVVVVASVVSLLPPNGILSNDATVKDNTGEVIEVNLDMQFPEGFPGHALKYSSSKILAHQATREFLVTNKPHYTLVTLHPTFVLGDSLIQEAADKISGLNALFWASLFSEKPKIPNAWVHVRDVADAHVTVLDNANIPSGTEILLSSSPRFSWDDAVAFIKSQFPALGSKLEPPFHGQWDVDTSTADKFLGLTWRSKETIASDVINQQLALRAAQK